MREVDRAHCTHLFGQLLRTAKLFERVLAEAHLTGEDVNSGAFAESLTNIGTLLAASAAKVEALHGPGAERRSGYDRRWRP